MPNCSRRMANSRRRPLKSTDNSESYIHLGWGMLDILWCDMTTHLVSIRRTIEGYKWRWGIRMPSSTDNRENCLPWKVWNFAFLNIGPSLTTLHDEWAEPFTRNTNQRTKKKKGGRPRNEATTFPQCLSGHWTEPWKWSHITKLSFMCCVQYP